MSVNKAIILGHLGADPTIKRFPDNGVIGNFTVATTVRGFTTTTGRQVPERTEWHNIVVRGRMAEVAGQYLHKGSKIYLEGEIRTRQWTDDNGQTRYVTEIHASTFEMLTPKQETQQQNYQPQQPTYQGQPSNPPQGQNNYQSNDNLSHDDHDDLPF